MTTTKIPDDDDHVEIRLPRSVLTVVERPRTVSQRTAERVLGLPRRSFLAAARSYQQDGGEVLEVGKLRLVHVDDFLRWLTTRSRAVGASRSAPRTGDDVDALERELGLVEVAS